MNKKEVKKLVNLKTISENAESTGFEGLLDEDIEIIITELSDEVREARMNSLLDEDAERYLDTLQEAIRREVMWVFRNLKYRDLGV